MAKKHLNQSDPTANRAVGNLGNIAADLQRRQRIREQADQLRNEQIRRAREKVARVHHGDDGGDAA